MCVMLITTITLHFFFKKMYFLNLKQFFDEYPFYCIGYISSMQTVFNSLLIVWFSFASSYHQLQWTHLAVDDHWQADVVTDIFVIIISKRWQQRRQRRQQRRQRHQQLHRTPVYIIYKIHLTLFRILFD